MQRSGRGPAVTALVGSIVVAAAFGDGGASHLHGGQTVVAPDVLIVRPNVSISARDEGFPLAVGLHPDGSSPQRIKAAFEHVAHQVRIVVALPHGPVRSGDGYSWGPIEDAEKAVLEAAGNARGVLPIRPAGQFLLVGFAEGATLACAIALRHPDNVTGVVAVGPSLVGGADAAPSTSKRAPRAVVLCAEGDPGVQQCQATARFLVRRGLRVESRLLTDKQASAGLDRLKEALYLVLYGRGMQ